MTDSTAKTTDPLTEIFPDTDLSENLATRRLLEAWYLLKGDDMAALVDTVKPRIFKLFAFGRFGTLQQLLYDVECFQEAGRSGIRVVYEADGKIFTTLKDRPYIFEDTPVESVDFVAERSRVELRGIQSFDEELRAGGTVDMSVTVSGRQLELKYRVPANAKRAAVELELYPLYTDYAAQDWQAPELLDYYCWNSRFHNPTGRFEEQVPNGVELSDRHGRVPRLRISAPGMTIKLTAFCDAARNDAHRLRLRVEGASEGRLSVELIQNPVTVHTPPIIRANRRHTIEITSASKPRVTVAGRPFATRAVAAGRWRSTIKAPHGVSRLLVESSAGVSDRLIAAVADVGGWVEKMGRAAAACLWPDGPVAGLMPQFIDVKRLKGKVRGPRGRSQRSVAYCSHNPRALMIIAAAARKTGDRFLLERAWQSILAMVQLAYKHEDGALVLPIAIYPDASPAWVDAVRPSDPIIAVRAILMVRSVFLAWGDEERAAEALEYAKGFARALLKMVGPDGQLEARYRYPTLEVTCKAQIPGRGTVNNWVTNLWDLAEILRKKRDPLAEPLRRLCIKHADLLIESTPSVLRLAGGGEDGPNNSDALYSTAGFFLIKYLSGGGNVWAQRAKEAFLMGALNNTILHIDQPQNFFFTFDWTESIWHDGPMNVQSKGGMHDLTACDVGLALSRLLDWSFARDMCAFQFLSRLVDGVFENGAVLNRVTAMPNFQYVKTDFTETLNFGAVGAFAFYHGRKWKRLSEGKKI